MVTTVPNILTSSHYQPHYTILFSQSCTARKLMVLQMEARIHVVDTTGNFIFVSNYSEQEGS